MLKKKPDRISAIIAMPAFLGIFSSDKPKSEFEVKHNGADIRYSVDIEISQSRGG